MSNYKRESILQDLQTALAGITVSNGYNYDIKTVTRNTFKEIQSMGVSSTPAIFIESGDEEIEPLANNLYRSTWTVILSLITDINSDISSESLLSKKLEKHIGDIKKQITTEMYVNYSFDSYVNKIDAVRTESYVDTNTNIGGAIINLNIEFDYSKTSP